MRVDAKRLTGPSLGHLLALGTIAVWGTTFIASTVALRTLHPNELLMFRLVIAIAALYLARRQKLKVLSRKHEWYMVGAALSGVVLYFLFENIALTYTNSSNCSVIISTAPFFVAIATRIFIREEKLTRAFFVGFVIAIAGVIMVSFAGRKLQLNPLGDGLCILAAVSWAFYSVFIRKLDGHGYNTLLVTRRIFLYGLLFMLPLTAVFGFSVTPADILNPATLGCVLFLGLVASALCFVTWNTAVKILGPIKSSAYIYLTPGITILFAWMLLGDTIQPMQIAGAALTLVGLMISQRRRRDERPVPAQPEAVAVVGVEASDAPENLAASEAAAFDSAEASEVPENLAAPEAATVDCVEASEAPENLTAPETVAVQ